MSESPFAPTPEAGAAYRVVRERCAKHLDAKTAEDYLSVQRITSDVMIWADAQPVEVRAAYAWGVDRVCGDAQSRFATYNNARAVGAAYAAIPKPP